ncbi:MAG: AAA family ATPase [Solirubrobacteraceae bacterium]
MPGDYLMVPREPAATGLVIRASDVKSRSIRWAWSGRLALGYLAVWTGIEGLGKSVLAAWVIARLTRGELPGEWRGQPVDVLVLAGEDGIEDTWKPRLDLAGADTARVAFLNLNGLGDDWNLRDGIEQVRQAVAETSARVIFIDAALDHMPAPKGGESIHSPTFVRRAFAPLKRAVRELDLVALFSMHPPKARSADFRDLVQASQAFSAIPRVGLLLAWHPDDEADDPGRRRVLIRGKGNLGRDPGALSFRVVGRQYRHDDGRETEREVVANVAPCAVTIGDLAPDKVIGAREPTKAERAAEIMRDALRDGGWHLATPIREELERQDLASGSVVSNGRRLAGAETRKRPGVTDGPWEWRIPAPDGTLESSEPARARCLSDGGIFDSKDQNVNNDGKIPRFPDPRRIVEDPWKIPSAEGYRARQDDDHAKPLPLVALVADHRQERDNGAGDPAHARGTDDELAAEGEARRLAFIARELARNEQ